MLTYADSWDSGRCTIRENAICARGIGFSGLPHEKCSDDFLAKPLICLWSTIDSAQVGLGACPCNEQGFEVTVRSVSRLAALGSSERGVARVGDSRGWG